jgi:hypothetical protein
MASTSSIIELLFRGNSADATAAIARLRRELLGLNDDNSRTARSSRLFGNDVDETSKKLNKAALGATKFVGALGAIGGALPAVAGLTASLATTAGAALVLPGVLLGAAGAVTVLKLATSGFGDAVKAADPKAFAEAVKGMPPDAIATAKAFRDLKQPLADIKTVIQNRFFDGLATDVKLLGQAYLPTLRRQFTGIAVEYNSMARAAVGALLAPRAVQDVNDVLAAQRGVLNDLKPALGNVLTGVLAIGQQGAVEFRGMGAAITDVTARFAAWAQRAQETGRITAIIREGKEELAKYGEIGSNIGGILSTVFRGLTVEGQGFADGLIETTQALEDFLQSAEGQDALQALGETLRVTAQVTREVLLAALRELGPIITAVAPAVQEFARVLGAVLVDAIRTVGPILQGFATALSALAPSFDFLVPALAGLVLGFGALRVINTVVGWVQAGAAAFRTLGVALGPLVLVLAIGAAIFALNNLRSSEEAAAEAAAKHESRIQSLKGTLDQYNGSVTESTRLQIAQELSGAKLADGTTNLTDALRGAGISFNDYAAAASGNGDALQKVNGQLLQQAEGVIKSSDAYEAQSKTLTKNGISLELLSAAALGNVQAQDQIAQKIEATGASAEAAKNRAQDLTDTFRDQIGPLGEIGSTLGDYSGALKDAQEQTRLAGQAGADFATILQSLQGGLAALKGNANPTAPLVTGFQDLAKAALTSATAAGQADVAYGGVAAGADTAARKVGESRDAFIQSAVAAGVSQAKAEALADSMGLIPDAVRTDFITNADAVGQSLNQINEQFSKVPGSKTVTVNALTDDAITKLETLGFKVEKLPNGQFIVTANTADALTQLDSALAEVNGAIGTFTLDANPADAEGRIKATVTLADGSVGTMTIDGNGQPAEIELNGVKYKVDSTTGIMTIDGDPKPGVANLNGFKLQTDRTTGTMIVAANTAPGQSSANAFYNSQNGRVITMTVRVTTTGDVLGKGNTGLAGGGLIGRPRRGNKTGQAMFASQGLVLGGYGPGRDTVGPLWLSPGEAVLVPELVRQIGPAAILHANRMASGGRRATVAGSWPGFAGGGFVPQSSGELGAALSANVRAVQRGDAGTVVVAPPQVVNHFYVDGQELTGRMRTEIARADRATARRVRAGAGATF